MTESISFPSEIHKKILAPVFERKTKSVESIFEYPLLQGLTFFIGMDAEHLENPCGAAALGKRDENLHVLSVILPLLVPGRT